MSGPDGHRGAANLVPVERESGAPVVLPAETLAWIEQRRAMYEDPRAAILPVLHRVQDELGWISLEAEEAVAQAMRMPLAKVHEVVTFYTLFKTQPQGRIRVDICQTMSCMLRGARELFAHMRDRYGVHPGETTADGRLTLHAVECLCNCECAPMAQIADTYHGPLTPAKLDELIAQAQPGETVSAAVTGTCAAAIAEKR
ncbi:MAG: NAD(P)H-dependent oxidoreductase subunit E [Candidatus Sumerlaeia bacterium]|nr:NAD(P)H-dependent oxidoreductase subunit E [Candidatus Sumerlaeia bacterium]